jgi:hypothetical protein
VQVCRNTLSLGFQSNTFAHFKGLVRLREALSRSAHGAGSSRKRQMAQRIKFGVIEVGNEPIQIIKKLASFRAECLFYFCVNARRMQRAADTAEKNSKLATNIIDVYDKSESDTVFRRWHEGRRAPFSLTFT